LVEKALALKPKVKICCISSIQEAELVINAGADAIGLVGPMPSGPGVISFSQIQEIRSVIGKTVDSFLLTSELTAERIISQHALTQTSTIQIVDNIGKAELVELKNALPRTQLVQVIHVQNEEAIQHAIDIQDYIDAILLDSGRPDKQIKILGGTGNIHNWNISRNIVNLISKPVWLAGGLNPDNVIEAYHKVKPYGIDLCSGLRSNKKLDEEKLNRFFVAINSI